MVLRVGFVVPEWSNKAFETFTNEELLEYWYKLRLVSKSGELDSLPSSTDLYIVSLQQEIIKRMEAK